MQTEKSLDGILKRYVFGALDDDARLALEERVVTEPEVFDALGVSGRRTHRGVSRGHSCRTAERNARSSGTSWPARIGASQVAVIRMLKNHASAFADPGRGHRTTHSCPGHGQCT